MDLNEIDNLAYIHLVLAQESPIPQPEPIGASWNREGWDAIFDTLDKPEEQQEEEWLQRLRKAELIKAILEVQKWAVIRMKQHPNKSNSG